MYLYIFSRVNNLNDMQVAGILVPLLKFYFHEEVRKAAVSGMKKIICCAFFHQGFFPYTVKFMIITITVYLL